MNMLMSTVLNEITGVLQQVNVNELEAAMGCITKERRIFVSGEGRSGFMARGFAMRLMHLGYSAFVVGETITPAALEGDVMIAVSGSGESSYVVSDVKKAKKSGCYVLAVTSKAQSTIAGVADTVLVVPGVVRSDSGDNRGSIQLLSSLFDQSVHITLDVLCLMLSERDDIGNAAATGKHW